MAFEKQTLIGKSDVVDIGWRTRFALSKVAAV